MVTPSPLTTLLYQWAATPHVWGLDDCMTAVADWCMACGHPDPLGDLRMAYDGPVSCERVTGFLSDPMRVGARLFEGNAGLLRGNELRVGDVGIIRRHDSLRWPLGAIWLGECWAGKGPQGTTTLDPSVIESLGFWSVGHAA